MKYAYVISDKNRSIRFFDFTDKTSINLCEYVGELYADEIYSWNQHVENYEYKSIEKLVSDIVEGDTIMPSDLYPKEVRELLNDPQYDDGLTYYDVCVKMLKEYNKLDVRMSLEELVQAMKA